MFSFDGRELAAVFAGGALGTLARAALEEFAGSDPGQGAPIFTHFSRSAICWLESFFPLGGICKSSLV